VFQTGPRRSKVAAVKRTLPVVASIRPVIISTLVLLPEPFGPGNPESLPGGRRSLRFHGAKAGKALGKADGLKHKVASSTPSGKDTTNNGRVPRVFPANNPVRCGIKSGRITMARAIREYYIYRILHRVARGTWKLR
jgi:hypothetical protein